MSIQTPKGLLATKQPDLFFEDNAVGRLKKEIWEADEAKLDAILADYGVPAPGAANGRNRVATSRPRFGMISKRSARKTITGSVKSGDLP